MKGYHNQPEMTASIIDPDGWLHTGDIAKIDKDGHIFITGRIKNMIVLQGGKKVFPEEVEAVLEKSDYISEVCVLGTMKMFGSKDGTEEVTAVIVPKQELYNTYSSDDVDRMINELGAESTKVADVNIESRVLGNFGVEADIVGRILGMKDGSEVGPVAGNATAFIIKNVKSTAPAETNDYSNIVREKVSQYTNRTMNDGVYNALKYNAKIKDNRNIIF